jgi:hypothetical protein
MNTLAREISSARSCHLFGKLMPTAFLETIFAARIRAGGFLGIPRPVNREKTGIFESDPVPKRLAKCGRFLKIGKHYRGTKVEGLEQVPRTCRVHRD